MVQYQDTWYLHLFEDRTRNYERQRLDHRSSQARNPPAQFITELAENLRHVDIPVDYISFSAQTMHPEIRANNVFWSSDKGASVLLRAHEVWNSPMFLKSPLASIFAGGPGFKQKLVTPLTPHDFPILHDLLGEGYTDYLIEPLQLTTKVRSYVSWSTKAKGGFSEQQYAFLTALTPMLEVIVTLFSKETALDGLLSAYLGQQAGRLVRSGQYKRGDGRSIEAVIWFSDLRGFTSFTDTHSIEETLRRLNHSFDVVGKSITEQNGEILKFIGDAVLAVFPVLEERSERDAARSAVLAAQNAIARLKQESLEGQDPIQIGIGLHRGIVTFGNVGTSNRLDFTVIGGPVNEASRVESLCKSLNEDVLMTDAIATLLPEYNLRNLGFHSLKGVTAQRELFGLTKN